VAGLPPPRAAFLGHVTAPNQEAALVVTWDEFGITSPAGRKRIIVQQMGAAE
jgi:hypothetical protein